MNELKIHDIKSIVEVPDFTFYIYYGLISLAIILVCIALYFIYRFFKNRKVNVRKEYFKILEELDLNDSKNSAYLITKYGQLLAQNESEKQLFNDLAASLEIYKYKKDVPKFSENIKASFTVFKDSLDV